MCSATPSQTVSSSANSPCSFAFPSETQMAWMGQRGQTQLFRQCDGNVVLLPKDSAALSVARQQAVFWAVMLTPLLVFFQALRNNASWRQGSKVANSHTVSKHYHGICTNTRISIF